MMARLRLIIWFIALTSLLLSATVLFIEGVKINGNILDLLPDSNQKTQQQASNEFTQRLGKQIIFLVGSESQQQAERAADFLFQRLNDSPNLFSTFNYQIDGDQQKAWAKFYFPYRLSLLSPRQQKLAEQHDYANIINSAMINLYGPMSMTNASLFKKDPFFLFQQFILSLPKPATQVSLIDNRLMIHHEGYWYVMLSGELGDNSFSMGNQKRATALIDAAKQQLLKQFPDTNLLSTGMLYYAKAGTDEAQKNISTIGLGSVIGILLLIILTFRSLSPLFMILLSCAIGLLSGFVVTSFVFGSVFLFTLVFGASLIGIAVDYGYFYYADRLLADEHWQPQQGLKNIFTGISFGLLNVLIAYGVLALLPFPALRQLALFACVGLFMAYLTVISFFPWVMKAHQTKPKNFLVTVTESYLIFWKKLTKKKVIILLTVLLLVSGYGISLIHTNDDIRILENPPKDLQQQQQFIKEIIGNEMDTQFLVVTAKTSEQVLQSEEQLQQVLHDHGISNQTLAISDYLPSVKQQKKNYQFQQQLLQQYFEDYAKKISLDPNQAQSIRQQLLAMPFKALTMDAWLTSPVSQSLRYLWLGKNGQDYRTVILLSQNLDKVKLKQSIANIPNITLIDKANEISALFKFYREKISALLLMAYVVLCLIFMFRYGIKKSLFLFIPPLLTCLLTLALLGYFSVPLTLFNLLALILVLGLSIDYVLFFAENNSHSTLLAIMLSAITTLLSFGLLTLSDTPVIHFFGLTVVIGISCACLLSPLVTLWREK